MRRHSRVGGNPVKCAAFVDELNSSRTDGALRAPLDSHLRGNDAGLCDDVVP